MSHRTALSQEDQRFLDSLVVALEDPDIARLYDINLSPAAIKEKTAEIQGVFIESGALKEEAAEESRRWMAQFDLGTRDGMEEMITASLASEAQTYLPAQLQAKAAVVPVRRAWTASINGLTVRLPTGAPAIVLDKGAHAFARMLSKSFWTNVDAIHFSPATRQEAAELFGMCLIYASTGPHPHFASACGASRRWTRARPRSHRRGT